VTRVSTSENSHGEAWPWSQDRHTLALFHKEGGHLNREGN